MTEKIWQKLAPRATRRNILLGMAFIVLVNALLFPLAARQMAAAAGSRARILDTRLYYGPAAVRELMDRLGPDGRACYRLATVLIDIPYALVYGLVYALLIIALFKTASPRWHFLVAFPLLISLFDLLENAAIITVTSLFPADLYPVEVMAGMATGAKWLFAAASATIIAAAGLLRLAEKKKK